MVLPPVYRMIKIDSTAGYVLDMIEPLRPATDPKILFMLKYHQLAPTDFIIREDGVCRLSPQLARAVAALIK